ncbi:MAG: hypothetical protein WC632_06235 [Candidatus Margulisiibacteriota bacterium]
MSIAQEMKSLADKIVGDYDARISVLGNIFSDTHDTLKGFNRDRVKMGAEQRKDLSSFVGDLVDTTSGLLKGFAGDHRKMATAQAKDLAKFAEDLVSNVKRMLKELQKEHKEMAEALEEALKTGETNRLKDFKAMLSGIQKRIMEIDKEVSSYLAEVKDDMTAASGAWQKMAEQMEKARHGVAIKIEKGKPIAAGIEVKTVEESAKPKKKGKRGRPRKS